MGVSIATPDSQILSTHSQLATIISEPPREILTHDVNKPLSYLHDTDAARDAQHEELTGHLRAIEDELLDLSDTLRRREAEVYVLSRDTTPSDLYSFIETEQWASPSNSSTSLDDVSSYVSSSLSPYLGPPTPRDVPSVPSVSTSEESSGSPLSKTSEDSLSPLLMGGMRPLPSEQFVVRRYPRQTFALYWRIENMLQEILNRAAIPPPPTEPETEEGSFEFSSGTLCERLEVILQRHREPLSQVHRPTPLYPFHLVPSVSFVMNHGLDRRPAWIYQDQASSLESGKGGSEGIQAEMGTGADRLEIDRPRHHMEKNLNRGIIFVEQESDVPIPPPGTVISVPTQPAPPLPTPLLPNDNTASDSLLRDILSVMRDNHSFQMVSLWNNRTF
ncbi:hypothetical protein BDM02DRAFT_3190143 [Thelephora ganbajun]|uniref:Uncharacterized protein n=1 Tax=Thelephora ganbajun TaxID=370292 RepID=A0ACB6Z5T8_THEGA|nr:hypothetical protein BDM02DRAFT_3190143 [Thelephora ganbajun]